MMTPTVDIQLACNEKHIPNEQQFTQWITLALTTIESLQTNSEVSLRIVSEEEIQTLNRDYRHKDKPTNVLSFPSDLPDFVESPLLGDIVICATIVEKEALAQGKVIEHHWAHMVIHGVLHLCGYDHIDESDAEEMESLEIKLLQTLKIPSPY